MCGESSTNTKVIFTVLYYDTLNCTVLNRTVLYCPALNCNVIYCTSLHCAALHCTALHCSKSPCVTFISFISGLGQDQPRHPGSVGASWSMGRIPGSWLFALVICEMWQVKSDMWHFTHEMWHMTHDFSSLSFNKKNIYIYKVIRYTIRTGQ